jgi:hypothetical protein
MELYIIAGPNGVGKTTFARTFLPKYADCKNFVNADLIAQGMSPFSPETAAIRAGRLVLSEIAFFSQRRVSFGFETTLSGRSYLRLIQRLKRKGYRVHLFFLFVESVDVALSRIQERVLKVVMMSPKGWCAAGSIVRSAISFRNISRLSIRGFCLTTQVRNQRQSPSRKGPNSV